jgi:hypothetical protein
MKSLVVGAALSAAVVGALVAGVSSAAAGEPAAGLDAASGISASGAVPIKPVPAVSSTDGTPVQKSLARSDLGAGVYTVSAQQGRAEASVANLDIAGLARAGLVRTWCTDGQGGLEIVDGAVLGVPMPRSPIGNDTVAVSSLVKVELNHQIANDDGTLTVEGITLTVLPGASSASRLLTGPEKAALPGLDALGISVPTAATTVADVLSALPSRGEPIVIGSATCGRLPQQKPVEDGTVDGPDDAPAAAVDSPPAAPKPKIVTAHLPVTG